MAEAWLSISLTDEQRDLVADNRPFALWFAKKAYAGCIQGLDDVTHDAIMGMCRAAQSYDPARGTFAAYARLAMHHEVIRRVKNYRHAGDSELLPDYRQDRSDINAMDREIDKRLFWGRIEELVGEREYRLLWLHYHDRVPLAEMARREGVTRKALSKRHRDIISRLRLRW